MKATETTRRLFLQATSAGVLAGALPTGSQWARAGESVGLGGVGRAKSVLLVLLSGGPSQLDMWDPKPEAPREIRGEFSSIETATPGLRICEHLPRTARRSERLAVIRTLSHTEHNHLLATHVALTGRPTPVPRGGSDLDRVQSRTDFPNFAAALDFVRPRNDGVPSGVSLPNYLIEGPLTWPGQHAGFLGVRHDPWSINSDPNEPTFRVDSLARQEGVPTQRLYSRRELLGELERGAGGDGRAAGYGSQQEVAFSLLTSGRVTEAFDIARERDEVR
ncbi:MAG: DUF1501 domain-containing protein, partial [Planctomycetaceae bacterium]